MINRKSPLTRREFLWLSSATTMAMAQGVTTRNIKPQRKGKASGLPFLSRFTDVAAQAALVRPVIYGGVHQKNYTWRQLAAAWLFLITIMTVGSTSLCCAGHVWTLLCHAQRIGYTRTIAMEPSQT
jgi:hypothetical protein